MFTVRSLGVEIPDGRQAGKPKKGLVAGFGVYSSVARG